MALSVSFVYCVFVYCLPGIFRSVQCNAQYPIAALADTVNNIIKMELSLHENVHLT